jgi:hypothetical protein
MESIRYSSRASYLLDRSYVRIEDTWAFTQATHKIHTTKVSLKLRNISVILKQCFDIKANATQIEFKTYTFMPESGETHKIQGCRVQTPYYFADMNGSPFHDNSIRQLSIVTVPLSSIEGYSILD